MPYQPNYQCFRQKHLLFLLLVVLQEQVPVRLLGISVSGLKGAAGMRQQQLFAGKDPAAKRQDINKALDEIQEKFGATAILPGRLLGEE